MEKYTQKIVVRDSLTLDQLKREIEAGGRFIIFDYCISPLACALQRFSPAIFVGKDESVKPWQRKYNLLSLFFGWWSQPGIMRTIGSIKANMRGGEDVTEDVMLQLDETNLAAREYEVTQLTKYFNKPDKWDKKELVKAFKPLGERERDIRRIVAGRYINTPENVLPHLVIGIDGNKGFDQYPPILKEALNTRFKKSTFFEFMDLKDDQAAMTAFLKKQGEVVFDRTARS